MLITFTDQQLRCFVQTLPREIRVLIITSLTSRLALNLNLDVVRPFQEKFSAMSRTQLSGEVNRRESLETWSFLYMVEGRGRLRPPFLPERKNRELLAECARPDQCFRNLMARDSRHVSSHEMGNSSTIRCKVRRGHTPDLCSIRSFCLRVKGHASSLANISNLETSSAWALALSRGTSMARPRNLTPWGA